jgi:hypothetical protein
MGAMAGSVPQQTKASSGRPEVAGAGVQTCFQISSILAPSRAAAPMDLIFLSHGYHAGAADPEGVEPRISESSQ